jgi:hypothetical protein
MRFFWDKQDFTTLIYFISTHVQIWEMTIPILMRSHLAHRWFYSEKEENKIDVYYRLQRLFSIRSIHDYMMETFLDQLT